MRKLELKFLPPFTVMTFGLPCVIWMKSIPLIIKDINTSILHYIKLGQFCDRFHMFYGLMLIICKRPGIYDGTTFTLLSTNYGFDMRHEFLLNYCFLFPSMKYLLTLPWIFHEFLMILMNRHESLNYPLICSVNWFPFIFTIFLQIYKTVFKTSSSICSK